MTFLQNVNKIAKKWGLDDVADTLAAQVVRDIKELYGGNPGLDDFRETVETVLYESGYSVYEILELDGLSLDIYDAYYPRNY